MYSRSIRIVLISTVIALLAGCSSADSPTGTGGDSGEGPFIWYVDGNTTGTGDGKSWENAFEHPSQAMDAAEAGDWIWIALANYYGTGDKTVPVLTFKPGVKVYGGFGGTETDLSQRSPANRAIFDGGDSLCSVVVGADDALLHGIKITGGNALGTTASGMESVGGGIYCFEATMRISNCDIYANSAHRGAGIFAGSDTVVIDSCYIKDNGLQDASPGEGGGMYLFMSTAVVSGCTFQSNRATIGAGIYLRDCMATFSNCAFNYNTTAERYDAGGVYIDNQSSMDLKPEFHGCMFLANSAFSGGAVAIYYSNPYFTNCEFRANIARSTNYNAAAAVISDFSSFYMEHCLFDNNNGPAAFVGDALGASPPRFFNCLFSRNGRNVDYGGAVYNFHVATEFEFCTFADNTAGHGGGIYNQGTFEPKVTNCILWSNTASSGEAQIEDTAGAASIVTYTNIDQDGFDTGTGNMRSNPFFAAGPSGSYYLSHTGAGPGQTFNSPCIDAGSGTAVSFLLHTMTTRSDNITDTGQADLGYHYKPVD